MVSGGGVINVVFLFVCVMMCEYTMCGHGVYPTMYVEAVGGGVKDIRRGSF